MVFPGAHSNLMFDMQMCLHTNESVATFGSLGQKCLVQLLGQAGSLSGGALSVSPPDSDCLLAVPKSPQPTAVTAVCLICSAGAAGISVLIYSDLCYF